MAPEHKHILQCPGSAPPPEAPDVVVSLLSFFFFLYVFLGFVPAILPKGPIQIRETTTFSFSGGAS
jgi:hypothetical protein